MPKKGAEKGHASFARPPSKYMVAVNLPDAEVSHRVNATVRDSRVNVFGQHVDEIKTKDGDIRYSFHGFSNEFELPDNVDPDSLTLSVADNQTILIQGDKRNRRGSQRKQSDSQQVPRQTRSQSKTQSPAQPLTANRKGRKTENKQGPTSWKAKKDDDVQPKRNQTYKPNHDGMMAACEPDTHWVKLRPVSPPRTPCCPLCCGPV